MPFRIRAATVLDAATLAVHRTLMFSDMGRVHDDATRAALIAGTHAFLLETMPTEQYLAWVAVDAASPTTIIAGAGVHRRQIMPFPIRGERATGVASGRQAIVMNVYTAPAWRRMGIGRALMSTVIAWSREVQLESLVLHASLEGRPLYEQLGFVGTNEMALIP